MRILVTGANGFIGRHLMTHLAAVQPADERFGTVFAADKASASAGYRAITVDLRDAADVTSLLRDVQPDVVYHLAAQSSPSLSHRQPWATLQGNLQMQFNLLQGCVELGIQPRTVVVSSASIHCGIQPEHLPITEESPLYPSDAYSVSKVAQDMMALQYFLSHRLPIVRARPFSTIGSGQSLSFVVPDFAVQIAQIEQGQLPPQIRVGNLDVARDFVDVRDMVRALVSLAGSGAAGNAYIVATGATVTVQQILSTLLSLSDHTIDVVVDPARLRPVDRPVLYGDAGKLHQATGWQPQIDIMNTLAEVLDEWRQRVLEPARS